MINIYIYNQRQQYFDNRLFKWGENLGKGYVFGALLTDLSKNFDCFPHELLIATLHVYDFVMKWLNSSYDYLSNRKQRVKLGRSYSSFRKVLYGGYAGIISRTTTI